MSDIEFQELDPLVIPRKSAWNGWTRLFSGSFDIRDLKLEVSLCAMGMVGEWYNVTAH